MRGRDWGFEVTVRFGFMRPEGPDRGRLIFRNGCPWGCKRIGGRAFPEHELRGEGFLMMPAGRYGPAFIVTPNFLRAQGIQ